MKKPEYIILHHSLTKDGKTVSWAAIRRYHVHYMHFHAIGYHFGIELVNETYEILMGRMMNVPGAHCRGVNDRSLGICFVGNFDIDTPEDSQLMVGKNLVRSLLDIYGLDRDAVKGHRDFSEKTCPGELFPIDEFRRAL